MKPCTSLFALLLVVAAIPSFLAAEEGGWGLPSLNPFSRKAGPPTSARISDGPVSGWKMPKLWPSSTSRSRGPSTWQRMTRGTQNLLSKTGDALNPWDDEPQPEPKISGSGSVFSRTSAKKDKETGSFFPSWSSSSQEEDKETVNSFLARPRPSFY